VDGVPYEVANGSEMVATLKKIGETWG
jgi:hypothetical protein